MTFHSKYALTLALVMSSHSPAGAAGPLLPQLSGTWGTGTSSHANGTRQIDMYLETNGAGVLAGSTAPRRDVNGSEGETSVGRTFIGMPIQAELDGDLLTVRPVPPKGGGAAEAARMTLTCHYDAAGPALLCTDPQGVTIAMQRRSETITGEVAEMLALIRAQPSSR
jgi:hypothetical protein